jgi:hypothetical protein
MQHENGFDGDSDMTPSFEETLHNAQNQLKAHKEERKRLLHQIGNIVLRIDIAGPDYDAGEDKAQKEEHEKSSSALLEKIEQYEALIKDLILTVQDEHAPETSFSRSTPSENAQFVYQSNKADKVTMDTSIPRFGPAKLALSAGSGVTLLAAPLEFLEKFHSQARNIHGNNFDKICSRLLCLAVLDDDQQRRLNRAIETTTEPLNWATCEQLFTDTLLTTLEKEEQAKAAICKGRREGESYEKYAWRLERIVRIYKICESPTHSTALKFMKATIPSEVLNSMNLRFAIENALKDVNADQVPLEITRADQFYTCLERMEGPDDCEERKRIRASFPEDTIEESRAAKRLKPNASDETQKPMLGKPKTFFDCDNGCGRNTTHDTSGCIICGNCKARGHYASKCPKDKAQASTSTSNPNNGHNSRGGYRGGLHRGGSPRGGNPNYRGRGGFVRPPWTDHQGTGANASNNAKQGKPSHAMWHDMKHALTTTNASNCSAFIFDNDEAENKCQEGKHGSQGNHSSTLTSELTTTDLNTDVHKRIITVHEALRVRHHAAAVRVHYQDHAIKTNASTNVQRDDLPFDMIPFSIGGEGESDTSTEKQNKAQMLKDIIGNDCDDELQMEYGIRIDPIDEILNDEYAQMSIVSDNTQKRFFAIRKKEQPDSRIIVKVSILGDIHEALVDTGASHSFIDSSIVSQYNLNVTKATGFIELADKSVIPRIGETEHVEIACGINIVSAPYEVIDQKYPLSIGMDLFHRFGFGITGLPDPNMQTHQLPEPEPDEKPSIIPLVIPDIEKTDDFITEKKAFMDEIRPLMVINNSIPLTSFCPLPEMMVYLPVPKGVVLNRRSRHFAYNQRPIIDEAVEKWLRDDVITLAPPGNPHNNTLTLAAKKDLEGNKTLWRVCLDPRPLNAHLPDDNFPIPLISDIMQRIADNAVFTTIDLRQAYHRLPIHEEDQPLTAFVHNGKQYMFKKAPFGLKPLSSLFQRGMSRILGDLAYVLNFIDDIIIFSRNREDHAAHVKEVLERLNKANLIVNQDKCHFFSTQVSLLGYIVDLHGKRVDPKKLVNIDEWLPPTTGKQIQSYMGTFNFFRDHLPLISTIASPLDELRNVPGPFELNEKQLESFNLLKNMLVQAPVLSFPDFNKPFYVATDASNVGIGAVLYQLPEGEGQPKKINYVSLVARSLQERERKYSATQKELLAIVFALLKFHYYLWQNPFTLYTDHRALTFIHSQKDLNSMLTGWQEVLMAYTFKVIHKPGAQNVLPDALSRQFPQYLWSERERNKSDGPQKVYGYTHMIQGEENPRQTVPESEKNVVLAEAHELNHAGTNAMVKHIHSLGKTWPNLAKDCLEYVKRCKECQRINIERKGYHPMKAIHAQLPGEHMAVDLVGQLPRTANGNVRLMVLVDICTRFVFLVPLKDKTAKTIATELFKIFTIIGFPRILQSDNGKEFVNEAVKEMTKLMGTQHRLATPYHPRGNGVAENHVKATMEIIRKKIQGKKHTWDEHVPMTQLALNTRVVALHDSSPFSLFFARRFNGFHNFTDDTGAPLSHCELEERLRYMTEVVFPAIDAKARSTQQKMIERFNRTILHNEFPDGAKVMALDPIGGDKLTPRYEGPYTVVRRNTGGAYVLKDGTGELLKRNYAPSQLKLVLDDLDDTDVYEVEKILAHRTDEEGGGVEYFVKWKDFPSEANTWEPEGNFIERKCINDYWRREPTVDSPDRSQSRQLSQRVTKKQQLHEQQKTQGVTGQTNRKSQQLSQRPVTRSQRRQ